MFIKSEGEWDIRVDISCGHIALGQPKISPIETERTSYALGCLFRTFDIALQEDEFAPVDFSYAKGVCVS